jgi:hypothetical protein
MSTLESHRVSSRSRIPPLFYEPESKRARSRTRAYENASAPKIDECASPEVKLLDLNSEAMDESTDATEPCGEQADAAPAATSADEEVLEGVTTSASEEAELIAAPLAAAIDGVQPVEAKPEAPAKLKGRAPKAKAGIKAKPDTVVVELAAEREVEGAAAATSAATHLESIPEEIVLIADTGVEPSPIVAPEAAKGKAKKAKSTGAKDVPAPVSSELGATAAGTGADPPTSDTAAIGKQIPLVFPKKKAVAAK